jgi:hypothetical protein
VFRNGLASFTLLASKSPIKYEKFVGLTLKHVMHDLTILLRPKLERERTSDCMNISRYQSSARERERGSKSSAWSSPTKARSRLHELSIENTLRPSSTKTRKRTHEFRLSPHLLEQRARE